MSAIEAAEKMPPMWGNSYWWTRAGALLGLASLVTGLVMASLLGLHLGSCGLQNQLTNPTLAIELAGAWEDVLAMVGPCQASHCGQSKDESGCYAVGGCKPICPDKVAALAFEQYLDFAFIALYWLFFLYLGLVSWRFCYWARFPVFTQVIGKIAGVAAIVAASLGAQADWRENDHILQALNELRLMSGPVPLMRDFAYVKWRFLFFAIGAASPLFLFWTGKSDNAGLRRSAFSQMLAWSTAVLALSTAWTGFAACLYGDDHRLEIATQHLDLVILVTTLTLATAQYWRGGTLAALDRLAHLPVLGFFATLFSSEVDSPQTSDTDPNRIP
jgi:hypothetical protein